MIQSPEKQKKFLSLTSTLADRLMADIRDRGLQLGETYMTSHEAAKFLGVAGASANRALQLLEKRKVIHRAQKRGCVILEPPERGKRLIDQVHFLVHDKYYRTEGIGGDGILFGIQSVLPTSTVSHCLLSQENEPQQISNLIERSLRQETSDAFVLVRASYAVQLMIAKSGLPAIVFGGLYPGITELGQIDRDHQQAAKLVIDYLRKMNCQRLAVLMRQEVLPGDYPTLDGLHESGMDLTLRFIPSEDDCIKAVAETLLERQNRPDAVLCHTKRHAECVDQIRRKLKIPAKQLPIVVLTAYLKRGENLPFPHIAQDSDPETIGQRIGELLRSRVSMDTLVLESVPVKLVHGLRK